MATVHYYMKVLRNLSQEGAWRVAGQVSFDPQKKQLSADYAD